MNVDDQRLADEGVELLQEMLRFNTTNPPGNETPLACFLAEKLRREGIPADVIESSPGRGNLIGRLVGTGELKPLMLASHLDVVAAEARRWRHDPFSGTVADGCIWGRGVLDMKGMTAFEVMSLIALKRTGYRHLRDLILVATADEEAGGGLGARFLVEQHADKIRSELALSEAGGFVSHVKGRKIMPVQVAERGFCWMTMIVRGEPGHGSIPRPETSAPFRAARIVEQLRTPLPLRVCAEAAAFIKGLAREMPLLERIILTLLVRPTTHRFAHRLIASANPQSADTFSAMLRDTANPTGLKGGEKTNVVPPEITIRVDGRMLPGQSQERFVESVRKHISAVISLDDVDIMVDQANPGTRISSPDEMIKRLQGHVAQEDPDIRLLPYLMTGLSDATHYHRLGIDCYGFYPLFLPEEIVFSELIHGHNERVSLAAWRRGLKVFISTVFDILGVTTA